jgi:enediyne biosynthesis protein E5
MTGMAFIVFTFYILTDPGTTPAKPQSQVFFGAAVAFAYCCCMVLHIVFGLFFALTAVCAVRGVMLCANAWRQQRVPVATQIDEALTASA